MAGENLNLLAAIDALRKRRTSVFHDIDNNDLCQTIAMFLIITPNKRIDMPRKARRALKYLPVKPDVLAIKAQLGRK
jgi:hypothetical protein